MKAIKFKEMKSDDMMLVKLQRWPPHPYMVKTLQKSSSLEPAGRFLRNLVCSIGDSSPSKYPGMILTYFMVRSNLVT